MHIRKFRFGLLVLLFLAVSGFLIWKHALGSGFIGEFKVGRGSSLTENPSLSRSPVTEAGGRQDRGAEQNTDVGCRSFVQSFYDWYVPIALQQHNESTLDIALRQRPNVFEPRLQSLLVTDSEAQSKSNEIVGLDFDPFLYDQDPSEHFAVQDIKKAENVCLATMFGVSSGQIRETVTPEVRFSNGHWRFANVHYFDGKQRWDLIGILKQWANARASAERKRNN